MTGMLLPIAMPLPGTPFWRMSRMPPSHNCCWMRLKYLPSILWSASDIPPPPPQPCYHLPPLTYPLYYLPGTYIG